MWEKIFKFIIELFKLAAVFLGCTILAGVLSSFLNDYQSIITNACLLIFITYLLIKILVFFSWVFDRNEIKSLIRSKSNIKDVSLYSWAGKSELENVFFYELLKDNAKEDVFENLKLIRVKLKERIKKKEDFHLIKNYLEASEKNSVFVNSYKVMAALVVAFLTTTVTKFITSTDGVKIIADIIFEPKKHEPVEKIQRLIDGLSIFVFLFSLIAFSINEFTRERRKIRVIKGVIESIIYEKENKD